MRKYLHNSVKLSSSIVQENITPPVMFMNNFNILSFQTLKNVDIIYILFINEFSYLFLHNNFLHFKHLHPPPFVIFPFGKTSHNVFPSLPVFLGGIHILSLTKEVRVGKYGA